MPFGLVTAGKAPGRHSGKPSRARRFYAPDDTVTAISIFKDYAGAEESNKRMDQRAELINRD